MNKKQAVIILTLLALIVCAGVYAAKINSSNLYVNSEDPTEEHTSSIKNTQAIFDEARLKYEQTNKDTINRLKTVMDDKNAPAEQKADATAKYNTLSMEMKFSDDIQTQLKLKGFEDVVCSIQNNTVNLMIKNKEVKLTDTQVKDIESVVLNVSKIKNIKLDIKQ